uniref:Small integral membrane protein 13 n=1 Tax=Coturnix japonica TaxID=93934 RepID=A0A8C2U3N4_COTJA
MWQSIGLTLLVIVATLACVLLFMLCGWYVVWQLFLSKFKFLRELIGDTGSQQGDNEHSETEADQETPPSPQRGRRAEPELCMALGKASRAQLNMAAPLHQHSVLGASQLFHGTVLPGTLRHSWAYSQLCRSTAQWLFVGIGIGKESSG